MDGGANRDLKDTMGRDPLHWACFWGQKDAAAKLIEKGANFGEDNRDVGSGAAPLHWAAWRNHSDLVAFLIEMKADPNSQSLQRNTPLHFAAEGGHLGIVKDSYFCFSENGCGFHFDFRRVFWYDLICFIFCHRFHIMFSRFFLSQGFVELWFQPQCAQRHGGDASDAGAGAH